MARPAPVDAPPGRRVATGTSTPGTDPKNGLTCTGKYCLSPEGYATWEALRQELQVELASLSTHSRHVVVEGSSHYIQYDDPELVVDAIIGRVVEAVR